MNQYFFSVSKAERENILDQHKTIYDGHVTLYGQQSNMKPLYVQDLANDKGGITVSNKGNVSTYKNVGINEDIDRRDRIGDGPYDLKNGTVDVDSFTDTMNSNHEMMHDTYPAPGYDDEYISLGKEFDDDDDMVEFVFSMNEEDDEIDVTLSTGAEETYDPYYEYDIDEVGDFKSDQINESILEVDEDLQDDFEEKLFESLDMFRRFKKYN